MPIKTTPESIKREIQASWTVVERAQRKQWGEELQMRLAELIHRSRQQPQFSSINKFKLTA